MCGGGAQPQICGPCGPCQRHARDSTPAAVRQCPQAPQLSPGLCPLYSLVGCCVRALPPSPLLPPPPSTQLPPLLRPVHAVRLYLACSPLLPLCACFPCALPLPCLPIRYLAPPTHQCTHPSVYAAPPPLHIGSVALPPLLPAAASAWPWGRVCMSLARQQGHRCVLGA